MDLCPTLDLLICSAVPSRARGTGRRGRLAIYVYTKTLFLTGRVFVCCRGFGDEDHGGWRTLWPFSECRHACKAHYHLIASSETYTTRSYTVWTLLEAIGAAVGRLAPFSPRGLSVYREGEPTGAVCGDFPRILGRWDAGMGAWTGTSAHCYAPPDDRFATLSCSRLLLLLVACRLGKV